MSYVRHLNWTKPSTKLPVKAVPLLVTFTDIDDPASVKRVDPDDLVASFGEGYALKAITLGITNEAVTEGRVEDVLGWIVEAGYLVPPEQQPKYSKDQTAEHRVSPGDFMDWQTRKTKRESR